MISPSDGRPAEAAVAAVYAVYEVGGWREGIDSPGERYGATCACPAVWRGATREAVGELLAAHRCDTTLPPLTAQQYERLRVVATYLEGERRLAAGAAVRQSWLRAVACGPL